MFSPSCGSLSRGLALVSREGPQREAGLDLFAQARDAAVTERFSLSALTIVDPEFAMEKAHAGDLDGAIEMARAVVDGAYESGDMIWRGRATAILVELLVRRGSAGDQHQAQAVIDRLAAVPTDPGFVLHELPLLQSRALLARAHGDENSRRNFHGTPPRQGSSGRLRSTRGHRRRDSQCAPNDPAAQQALKFTHPERVSQTLIIVGGPADHDVHIGGAAVLDLDFRIAEGGPVMR
jgi:hypothetical protein